jgi:hypothetical protein
MATSDRVRERIRELALKLALEDLDELDEEDGDCWLDAIENRAIEIGDALTAALIEERSRDRPCAGESLCPQCGKLGRYRGSRERELISRRGPVTLAEPEYYCPACRKAFFPSDPGARH